MKILFNLIVMAALVAMPLSAQNEWTVIANPDAHMYNLYSITVTPNGTVHAVGENGIYIRDTGNGFEMQPDPTNGDIKKIIAIDDSILYYCARGNNNGIIGKTTNGGDDWTGTFLEDIPLSDITFWDADSGLASGDNTTILRTTDGETWTDVYSNPAGGKIYSIKRINPNTFLAGGFDENYQGLLLRSDDKGLTWNIIDIGTTDAIREIDSRNSNVYIATGGSSYMLKSIDEAITFSAISVPVSNGMEGFSVVSEDVLYIYSNRTIYYSNNGGSAWEEVENQLSSAIEHLNINPESGETWLVGDNGLIAYNPAIPLSVELINTQIPNGYTLMQNYPNPFNPTTNIEYAIPVSSVVTIIVYNTLGQIVDNLVNEFQPAGTYRITWNGNDLPSGIYFYQINTLTFTKTMKMMLVK